MLGLRLETANRISRERWDRYHADSSYPVRVPRGAYRKAKGCECRGCSARKTNLKRQTNIRVRRSHGAIATGGAYKRFDDPWNHS